MSLRRLVILGAFLLLIGLGITAAMLQGRPSADVTPTAADFVLLVLKPGEAEVAAGENQQRLVALYGKNGFAGPVSLSFT